MAFRLTDTLAARLLHKTQSKQKSELAFRDESEKARRSIIQFDKELSKRLQQRFLEITDTELVDAIRLPAKEFESRYIPVFVHLFEDCYASKPEAFNTVLKSIQEEMVQVAAQLQKENTVQNYLPYVDTFRVRVLRAVVEAQKKKK